MKNIISLFFLITLSRLSFSQTNNNFAMIIHGKEFKSPAKIDTTDIKYLAELQIKNVSTQQTRNVSSFQWVMSHSGAIYKGSFPVVSGGIICFNNKFPSFYELMASIKHNDIVFLEHIKLNEVKTELQGQFALTLE